MDERGMRMPQYRLYDTRFGEKMQLWEGVRCKGRGRVTTHGRRVAFFQTPCLIFLITLVCRGLLASGEISTAAQSGAEKAPGIVNGEAVYELLDRFVTWLKGNGAQFDKVKPIWSPEAGFHLQVLEECQAREILVKMPITLMIGPKVCVFVCDTWY